MVSSNAQMAAFGTYAFVSGVTAILNPSLLITIFSPITQTLERLTGLPAITSKLALQGKGQIAIIGALASAIGGYYYLALLTADEKFKRNTVPCRLAFASMCFYACAFTQQGNSMLLAFGIGDLVSAAAMGMTVGWRRGGSARSYASVAKQNRPAALNATPDPSLLQTRPAAHSDSNGSADKVQLVDAEEAELLRAAIAADVSPTTGAGITVTGTPNVAFERAERVVAGIESESEDEEEERKKEEEEEKEEVKKLGRKRTMEEEVQARALKVRKGVEKEARKVERKVNKAKKEIEEFDRKHPAALGGVVGLVNLAIVGTLSILAYRNWHTRETWDKRVVLGLGLGLASLTVGEGFLGYYEVEKHSSDKAKSAKK